jgi:3-hydroxyacyl-CoA dehydrogenase
VLFLMLCISSKALIASLETVFGDDKIAGVVLAGKNSFVAGADIKQMNQGSAPLDDAFVRLFSLLEEANKPVVAAISQFALGGGLELALVCSGRVTHSSAQLVFCCCVFFFLVSFFVDSCSKGLPEQQLGLIPGWGGTQRLPRLLGVVKSLEMILSGQPVSGKEAFAVGLVDGVVSSTDLVLGAAVKLAREPRSASLSVLSRRLSKEELTTSEMVLAEAERRTASIVGVIHSKAAIDAIRACVILCVVFFCFSSK